MIHRSASPVWAGKFRKLRANGSHKGPVVRVLGTLVDPFFKQSLLVDREMTVRLGGRHLLVRIFRVDASDDGTFRGLARLDCVGLDGLVTNVESEVCLSFVSVLTVAVEAVFGEDWTDVAVEVDGFFR